MNQIDFPFYSFNSWGAQIPETVFHLIYSIHLIIKFI